MADLIAIVILSFEYAVIVLAGEKIARSSVPLSFVIGSFLLLVALGVFVWHQKKSRNRGYWSRAAWQSLALGLLFLIADLFWGHLLRQPSVLRGGGGLLGLPLVLLVCPGYTMISLAGAVRSSYLRTAH